MIELEVKILNMDLDQLEQRLGEIGAKYLGEEEQINRVFDSQEKLIEKKNAYLRIRQSSNSLSKDSNINLTYKESLGQGKLRKNKEYDISIKNQEDMENLISVLGFLGYKSRSIGYKNRRSYEYEGIRFDLDRWDETTYPYPYMEIEVKCPEDLDRAIELLDIDRKNISNKSISELRQELKA